MIIKRHTLECKCHTILDCQRSRSGTEIQHLCDTSKLLITVLLRQKHFLLMCEGSQIGSPTKDHLSVVESNRDWICAAQHYNTQYLQSFKVYISATKARGCQIPRKYIIVGRKTRIALNIRKPIVGGHQILANATMQSQHDTVLISYTLQTAHLILD